MSFCTGSNLPVTQLDEL